MRRHGTIKQRLFGTFGEIRTNPAADLMTEADRHVQESQTALEDMTAAMTGIRESSARVSAIIRTIEQIALQTTQTTAAAAEQGAAGAGELHAQMLDTRSLVEHLDRLVHDAQARPQPTRHPHAEDVPTPRAA